MSEHGVAVQLVCGGLAPALDNVDLVVSFGETSTAQDLVAAVIVGLGSDQATGDVTLSSERHGSIAPTTLLVDLQLMRGETLRVSTGSAPPARTPPGRRGHDLWLRDERGRHAGRLTPIPTVGQLTLCNGIVGADACGGDKANATADAVITRESDGSYSVRSTHDSIAVDGRRASGSMRLRAGQSLTFGGTSLWRVVDAPDGVAPNHAGQFPFLPGIPDPAQPPDTVRLTGPRLDVPEPLRPTFPWETTVPSVIIAAVFGFAFGHAHYALFGIFPLLIGVFTYLRRLRDRARATQARTELLSSRLDRLDEMVAQQRRAESDLRHANHPTLADLVERALTRSESLWNRAIDSATFLQLRVGSCNVKMRASLDAASLVAPDGEAPELDRTLETVPATIDLRSHSFGVIGEGPGFARLIADLCLQAAVLHSPKDLRVVVAASEHGNATLFNELLPLAWLPHVQQSGVPTRFCDEPVAVDLQLARTRQELAQLTAAGVPPGQLPHTLLLVHETCAPDPVLLHGVRTSYPDHVHVLWCGSDAKCVLPEVDAAATVTPSPVGLALHCDSELTEWDTADLDGGRPTVTMPPGWEDHDSLGIAARAMAPLYDPRDTVQREGLPETVDLVSLLRSARPHDDPAADRSLLITLGVGEDGPVTLDLVAEGPHCLIGGTTGSGKSELLQSMVASLVTKYRPEDVELFLFDFKGGATFSDGAALAHTKGSVTNLTEFEVERALRFLSAELHYRMDLFDELGRSLGRPIRDFEQYRAQAGAAPLARLVVLFDEFAALAGKFDSARETVAEIAQQGRSLGVHVVPSTQRPSTATLSADALANIGTRIALRTVSDAESDAILGSSDAARIPADVPGRGLVQMGPSPARAFQAPHASKQLDDLASPPVLLAPFRQPPRVPRRDRRNKGSGLSAYERVLRAVPSGGTAHDGGRLKPSFRPDPWGVASYVAAEDTAPSSGRLAIGVCDDIASRSRFSFDIDLTKGAALVAGGLGSGKTTALLAVVDQVHRFATTPVDVIGVDSASEALASAGPSFGWVVPGGSKALVTLLIAQLRTELDRRQRPGATAVPPTPTYLLIDDIQQVCDLFMHTLEDQQILSSLADVVRRGRRHGIYVISTAPTLQFGNAALRGVFGTRLQLRPTPDEEDAWPGGLALHPGIAWDMQRRQVKLFAPTAAGVADGRGVARRWYGELPDHLELADLPPTDNAVMIGMEEITREAVTATFERDEHLLVIGDDAEEVAAAVDVVASQLAALGTPIIDPSRTPARVAEYTAGTVFVIPDLRLLPEPVVVAIKNVMDREKVVVVAGFSPRLLLESREELAILRQVLTPLTFAQRALFLGATEFGRAKVSATLAFPMTDRHDLQGLRGRAMYVNGVRGRIVQVAGL